MRRRPFFAIVYHFCDLKSGCRVVNMATTRKIRFQPQEWLGAAKNAKNGRLENRTLFLVIRFGLEVFFLLNLIFNQPLAQAPLIGHKFYQFWVGSLFSSFSRRKIDHESSKMSREKKCCVTNYVTLKVYHGHCYVLISHTLAPETKKCLVRFDKIIETWTIFKPFAKSSHLDKNSRKKVRKITPLTACPDVHKFSNVVQKPLKPCSSRHF